MTTVIFDSVYGSTQRYAQELANQLNAEILPLADAKNQAHLDKLGVDKQPLIVMSPVHGPSITAADFVKKHDFGDRPVAVVVVGMTLLEEARAKDQLCGAGAHRSMGTAQLLKLAHAHLFHQMV
ncbi:flavodoxin domain-containing protein [Corynebacterium striatum]|uniref:flavodoxin domain-containing protein n=1 Tax=Corynebacterium striatum TaxID=43770 RepID=UPI001A29AE5B|nr:flavodoxin domain-containing protein [Corynebacterium striatum]HAT1211791.1 hypothetical protein [Corynebacterium striatum]HAT1476210.1 hypothetical protein [Corynebacterium striatum]HAT6524253.1 hypothetical protein [Corynebacterium striatum]HAT6562384.1 hypothetical protein [Corynebacterium striatum]HAT6567826.1 hypothetical protein [Corynebacterium striatum]